MAKYFVTIEVNIAIQAETSAAATEIAEKYAEKQLIAPDLDGQFGEPVIEVDAPRLFADDGE